jgi:hypothetical protein
MEAVDEKGNPGVLGEKILGGVMHERSLLRKPTTATRTLWTTLIWRKMSKVAIHQVAPDFKLTDYQGKTIQLSQYRGQKNVVLIFNRGFT